ncbi:hypothetical protein AeMF1_019211 [Aphanomyces euteiches]|nr:hypothetical protein AeMF1_019211 [Aphanomyces euteiches]
MTKVEEFRQPAARSASFSRWSIAYNVFFAFNLISTPFTAYLNEPQPGGVEASNFPSWDSFDEYVNGTATFLQRIYNNKTVDVSSITAHDIATNSFALRYSMTLPFEVPGNKTFDHYIRMPGGGALYGNGVREFVTNFLASNETLRNEMQPWRMCQHERLMSFTYGELCVWILSDTEPSQYIVWGAAIVRESPESCWAKLAYRCFLSSYFSYVLWTRYYRHYIPLLTNLRHLGLDPKYDRYEIVVGDPLYAILSEPVLVILAIMRVTQFHDAWVYVCGCMYLARLIWTSYLGAQVLSFAAKRRQWEKIYAAIDPAFIAIATYFQCGPLMTLMCSTPIVWTFYTFGCFFQSAELDNQAVESISASLLLAATLPIPLSHASLAWRQRKRNRVDVTNSIVIRQKVSKFSFNDLKALLFIALTVKRFPKNSIGGSLHKLYYKNPRYRKLPLISHRAADCFILCYNIDGGLDMQVRLSLLSCMDRLEDDPDLAIPMCSSAHSRCVCVIDKEGCETFKASAKTRQCIHVADSNCQWVM